MKEKKLKVIMTVFFISIIVILIYFLMFQKSFKSIQLNKQYISIYEGDSDKLETTFDGQVEFTSENNDIAIVTSTGIVIGIKEGITKIIISTLDGKNSNSCVVNVLKKEIELFTLDKEVINLKIGEEIKINSIIKPQELSSEKITWISSNNSVVNVLEDGRIKAINNGISVISAKVLGKEAKCSVIVGQKIDSLKLDNNEISLFINEEHQLKVNVNPLNAIVEQMIWTSSNDSIVNVDENGNITAKQKGDAIITVESKYTKVKDICLVKVIMQYEIKYIDLNKVELKNEGDVLGTLPSMSKEGYKFLGWYTSVSGGEKVSENTSVVNNMILYPHWEKEYIITDDIRYSNYSLIALCNSDTMKYRIINYNNNDIVLVWVANSPSQLKLGLAKSNANGVDSIENIINKEVPSNKCMIAINASYFENGTPTTGVIIHDGKLIKNTGLSSGFIGINTSGKLLEYSHQNANQIVAAGVINSWTISGSISVPAKEEGVSDDRTQICQIDNNNFALISGSGKVNAIANTLYNFVGQKCSTVFNLDGGGSRKLYYKTKSSNLVKRFGSDRKIPDILYFVEK